MGVDDNILSLRRDSCLAFFCIDYLSQINVSDGFVMMTAAQTLFQYYYYFYYYYFFYTPGSKETRG